MIRHRLFRFLVLGFLAAAVSACATAPTSPIAKQYRQEANSEDVSFTMVLQNPDAYINDIVLWGGSIIESTNIENGTEIIVLQAPLGSGERPENAESSLGRFIAMSSKFLDPAIYTKGKQLTLAGQVTGKKILKLGKTSYTYPVVTIKQLYLWKNPQYYYYGNPYPYPYPYDYWYRGWGPYWGPYDDWYPWYAPYPGHYRDSDEDHERREGHPDNGGEERGREDRK